MDGWVIWFKWVSVVIPLRSGGGRAAAGCSQGRDHVHAKQSRRGSATASLGRRVHPAPQARSESHRWPLTTVPDAGDRAGIPALSIGRGIHRGRPRGRPGSRHAPLLPAPAATGRTVSMAIENDGLQDTVAPGESFTPSSEGAPWRARRHGAAGRCGRRAEPGSPAPPSPLSQDLAPGLKSRVPGQLRRGRLVTPVPPLDRTAPLGRTLRVPISSPSRGAGRIRVLALALRRARGVGPTPGGPRKTRFSLRSTKPSFVSSRSAPAESTAGG